MYVPEQSRPNSTGNRIMTSAKINLAEAQNKMWDTVKDLSMMPGNIMDTENGRKATELSQRIQGDIGELRELLARLHHEI